MPELDTDDAVACSATHLADKHVQELRQLIADVPSDAGDERNYERCLERYQFVLDQYQEQPHLLDPVLPELVRLLLDKIDIKSTQLDLTAPESTLAFRLEEFSVKLLRYLHHACKVRGDKALLRLLPHDPDFVQPVIGTLCVAAELNEQKFRQVPWETEYMLLLWMVILAKTPFDLTRFDGNTEGNTLVERIHAVCAVYLLRTDKTQQVAALLFAELLSRPDVSGKLLNTAIQSALQQLKALPDLRQLVHARCATSQLQLLARILKQARRSDLQPLVDQMLDVVLQLPVCELPLPDTTIRKLTTKVLQRLALILLPPRLASWRYQRGARSLAANLQQTTDTNPNDVLVPQQQPEVSQKNGADMDDEEDDEELPEALEPVLDRLLLCLSDQDTVVRWSSAKGVGRVCQRLPRSAADQVVAGVFAVFENSADDENSWHGACLALAELARRGLVLPDNLQQVVLVLCKALVFERQCGRHSVGAHVRDAACYVCWSLARAFQPEQLGPYVSQVAGCLLTVAVADREVNVRRAAAAAFQENVGRQQANIPNGIDVVTTVDYQAVGQRQRCYDKLAAFIVSLDAYYQIYTEHLLAMKVGHWDEMMRRLCAVALGRLAAARPEYAAATVLPHLKPRCVSAGNMFERQGALLGTGAVLLALAQSGTAVAQTNTVDDCQPWAHVISHIHAKPELYYSGIAADVTRAGVNDYVRDLAKAVLLSIPDWPEADVERLLQMFSGLHAAVMQNIGHKRPDLRQSAAEALLHLHLCVVNCDAGRAQLGRYVTEQYLPLVQSRSEECQRQAGALALAALPHQLVDHTVIQALIAAANCYDKAVQCWADARVDSLNALSTLHHRLRQHQAAAMPGLHRQLYDCYMRGFVDYTIDNRGDIGRYVRDAVLTNMTNFLIAEHDRTSSEELNAAVGRILQQSCEKIDSTRQLAVECMQKLLQCEPLTHNMHQVQLLNQVFLAERSSNDAAVTFGSVDGGALLATDVDFDRLSALLTSDAAFAQDVLVSFVVSAGGLSESTQRASSKALMGVISEHNMGERLLCILREHAGTERIMTPLLNVLDNALASDALDVDMEDCEWLKEMFHLVAKETLNKKAPRRITLGVSVCCAFIQFDELPQLRDAAIDKVSKCLLHVYPVVRRATADKLYEAMLMYGQLDNHNEWVMGVLSETRWDAPIEELKPVVDEIRAKLCPVDS